MKRIAILGAGTAGTAMANKLRRALGADWAITVIDRDNEHLYQPGLIFVPFRMNRAPELVRRRDTLFAPGIELKLATVDRVEPDASRIVFEGGEVVDYDLLIVATGTRTVPEETEGLTGPGWHEKVFDFYTFEGSTKLAAFLGDWEGGQFVLNIVDMPIKCPVAPLEFLFLAEAYFTERGIRDKVEMTFATPLDAAFTKPRAAAAFGSMLEERGIHVETDFACSKVDGAGGKIHAWDGRAVDFDLLVTVPLHFGSEVISMSGMGDASGFLPVDKHTLQSTRWENVFGIGDATNVPTSKAGSVAHFMADVLFENLLRVIDGLPPEPQFDGHANCFIETGYGKAMLIDFNYETEPLPGSWPLPGIGPFTLLGESRMNHWGKLGFRWAYWHLLLEGKDIPIDHRMVMAGKRS